MVRLQSLRSTGKAAWSEYGGWIILLFVAYGLWTFRKLFSTIGGGAGDIAQAAIAKQLAEAQTKLDAVNAAAEKKAQQTKVQAATGSTVKYSDAQLAQFEADARTLVGMLGQGNLGMATVFKDMQGAFSLIKQKYSRLNLYNNKPWKYKDKAKRTGVVSQSAETADSVKNPYNYKVLAPFYKDITDGRDLVADFRYFVGGSDRTKLFKWIL